MVVVPQVRRCDALGARLGVGEADGVGVAAHAIQVPAAHATLQWTIRQEVASSGSNDSIRVRGLLNYETICFTNFPSHIHNEEWKDNELCEGALMHRISETVSFSFTFATGGAVQELEFAHRYHVDQRRVFFGAPMWRANSCRNPEYVMHALD